MGSDPPNKLSEEVRREVKSRLESGESPEDIADDDSMPSRRTVYNIKSEWEEAVERQEELEQDVFRDSSDADRSDIIDVLDQAGVGIKQSGEPKAKVEKALNAIDFDSAWDDPHYVADLLVQEASMSREWANRVVRKAYDMPDFPYVDQPGSDDSRGGGSRRQRSRRGSGGNQTQPRQQRGRGRQNNRNQRQRDNSGGDDQLRREMKQLRSTVSDLAETVTAVAESESRQDTVTVERNGEMMEVPSDSPMLYQMMMDDGGDDDDDFIDKLRAAKEAGIIPDPDDFKQEDTGTDMFEMLEKAKKLGLIGDDDGADEVEVMQSMVDEMSEQFAEAQSNVATQMSAAISQLAEEDEDESDEITVEELESWWEEKQKEDELDRLESELRDMKEELRDQNRGRRSQPADPEQDPDVVKKRIDTQHERDQLEMAKETIEQAPDHIAAGIQEGLLPLFDRLKMQQDEDTHPAWSPPDEEQRERPAFAPSGSGGGGRGQDRRTTAQARQSEAERQEYPEPDTDTRTAPETNGEMAAEEQPQSVSEEKVDNVRDRLGLNDDGGEQTTDA